MNEFEEKLGNLIEEKIKNVLEHKGILTKSDLEDILKKSGLLDLVKIQKLIGVKEEPVWEHIIHCESCRKELEKRGYKIFKIVPYSKK